MAKNVRVLKNVKYYWESLHLSSEMFLGEVLFGALGQDIFSHPVKDSFLVIPLNSQVHGDGIEAILVAPIARQLQRASTWRARHEKKHPVVSVCTWPSRSHPPCQSRAKLISGLAKQVIFHGLNRLLIERLFQKAWYPITSEAEHSVPICLRSWGSQFAQEQSELGDVLINVKYITE